MEVSLRSWVGVLALLILGAAPVHARVHGQTFSTADLDPALNKFEDDL